MASNLAYIGFKGDRVELDGPLVYVGTALGIRGRQWSYTLGRRGISNQARVAREAELTADFLTLDAADAARRIMDFDVGAGTPGKLVTPDGWEQRAYVVEQSPSDRYHGWVRADLKLLLLDGVWRKLVVGAYGTGGKGDDYGKAYSYGYMYDYAPPDNASVVNVDSPTSCPMRLVIYGHVENPEITIGGNLYRFDVEVPTGGYLVVDTRPDPSVTLHDSSGRTSDVFGCAHRGSGEGCGEYAFERLKPGANTIDWDNSFGFDLGVYLEEGEIPWTS